MSYHKKLTPNNVTQQETGLTSHVVRIVTNWKPSVQFEKKITWCQNQNFV